MSYIPGFRQNRRFEELFGGGYNPDNPSPTNPDEGVIDQDAFDIPQQENNFDPMARYRELYTPDTHASDRYDKALGEMPTRNKPGWLRKGAAIATAFSQKPELVEHALYAPYHRNLRDWQSKIDPLAKSAELERANNSNMRMVANSILSNEMADRRLQETVRSNNTRYGQGQQRIDLTRDQGQQKIDIARAMLNGGTVKINDDGSATLLTKDGRRIDVTDDYMNMDWEEKEAIKAKYAQQRAETIAKARTENAPPKLSSPMIRKNPATGVDEYGHINLTTGEWVTTKQPEGGGVAPQVKTIDMVRDINMRAREIADRNPHWKDWITFDRQQRFTGIKQPPSGPLAQFGFGSGPSPEVYAQITEAIHGPGSGQGLPGNQPPAQQGGVRFKDTKTGRTGTTSNKNHPKILSGEWVVEGAR